MVIIMTIFNQSTHSLKGSFQWGPANNNNNNDDDDGPNNEQIKVRSNIKVGERLFLKFS